MNKLKFELRQQNYLNMNSNFSQLYVSIYDFFKKSEFSGAVGNSKLAFAKFLGVSQGKTQHWEKGQWPSAKDIENIHKKLGISCAWLVTGEGEMLQSDMQTSPDPTQAVSSPEMLSEITRLRAELDEANRLNRQLVARLFVDGTGDKDDSKNTAGKAADGQ